MFGRSNREKHISSPSPAFTRGPISTRSQSEGLDDARRPPSEERIFERVSTPRFMLMAVPLGIWSCAGDRGLPTHEGSAVRRSTVILLFLSVENHVLAPS